MQRKSSLDDTTRSKSSFNSHRPQNAENLTLIWFDVAIDKNSGDKNRTMAIEQFRQIINDVHVFDDVDACADYMTDVKNEFIFLIITDFANDLGQALNQFAHIHSIYIYRNDDTTSQHEPLLIKHQKLRGISSSITSICAQLRKDAKQCERDTIGFHVVGDKNLTNDQQEANFMYAQLLKECLLDIANNENNDIADLIVYCRRYYADNQHELARIDELERDYAKHSPVWWYTRDGFLYKMLNKALRIQDVETLYAMRIFTKELHEQLVSLHHREQNNFTDSTSFRQTILYRGQQMPSDDFATLKNNQGGLLSINSFLSTSENKNLAIMFAGDNSSLDDTMTAVLLQIHVIDNDNSTPPFAHIDQLSFFGEAENEVLFSMGTVFRIESVTENQTNGGIWLVELILTNANDPQLTQLTQYMREQVQDATARDRLCNLLLNTGEYAQAERYLQRALLEIADSDYRSQAALHHQIGFLYHEMGDLEKAVMEYEQSLAIKLSYLPDDDSELAITIANMSTIYRELGQLDLALTYIQRALDIDRRQSNDETVLASRFHCMGMVLHDQNRIDEAIEQFDKALAIWMRYLPSTHPSIAESSSNLAAIYYAQQRYEEALNMYKKCLDIETKSLPAGHPSMAITYNNIAYTYYHQGHYQEALDHSLKAIELSSRALGDKHPNTDIFRNTLQTIRQKLSSPFDEVHSSENTKNELL